MNFANKLYATISISFILLFFSMYLSSKSINETTKIIKHVETKQLKLSHLASSLNHDVERNQADILQAIILKDIYSIQNINNSFDKLQKLVNRVDTFIKSKNINFKEMQDVMNIIKKRMVGYQSVQSSLIEALQTQDEEDIQDALIGFNAITIKFSENIDTLLSLADNRLKEYIVELKQTNDETKQGIVYSYLLAMILIFFSVHKLLNLHRKVKTELNRAEKAEQEQKKLQSQLLRYNDDLEEEIAKKTKEIHQKIYTHFISGMPNRNQLLEDSHRYNFKQMALLNIDKFQKFNDVYGEEIGNIAIKMSAEFLQEQVDDENTLLYHIGGDEFVIVVKHASDLHHAFFIEKIENVLRNYAKESFIYDNKKFNLIMSAGIAFSGRKKMLAYADMALKDAKSRNVQLSIFNDDKELERIHKDDIECHKKLLNAFESHSILSYYQPISPIQDSSKATKYESLVRLRDENQKIIPPHSFIHVAKINRIYNKLTQIVLNNTLEMIEKYQVPASLNISMDDIENHQTLHLLYNRFDEYEFNHLLTIELLETEEFKDYDAVFEFCTKVRSYGIKIALDDFGAGYSNFSHILKLPVDFIKIDASLISNIDRDTHSVIMVETIVGLAKKLHIETIAGFVSSKEILEVVKKLGVDYAQGYHIGKPEPIENHLSRLS